MRVTLTAASFYWDPARPAHLTTSANLGLYHLAAVAREAGHEAAVVDPSRGPSRLPDSDFAEAFASSAVVGVSATTSIWGETRKLLERLAALEPPPVIIVGGPHASLFDEHVLRTTGAAYVVRGEGDHAFPELLGKLEDRVDPAGLPGVSCLRDGALARGADRPLLTESELAALPLPLYDLIPRDYYKVFPIETSRGCPHRCVFCSITHPRTWRDMGADRLGRAIEIGRDMVSGFTDHALHLVDDCFLSKGRDLEALGRVMGGLETPIVMSTRVSNLREPRVLDFYATLPVGVCELGVECGYAEGIKKVGKGVTLEQVEQMAALLQERGLSDRVLYAYVIGFPWEGKAECLATVKFAFNLARRYGGRIQIGWFMLYPGSEIFLHPERYGLDFKASDYDLPSFMHDQEVFMRMRPRLSPEDVRDVEYSAKFLQQVHPQVNAFLMMW